MEEHARHKTWHQGSLGATTAGNDIYKVTRTVSNKPRYSLQDGEGEEGRGRMQVPEASVLGALEGQ